MTVANAVLLWAAPVGQCVARSSQTSCTLLSVWPWAGQALRPEAVSARGDAALGESEGVRPVG